jgi:hypothetical protein
MFGKEGQEGIVQRTIRQIFKTEQVSRCLPLSNSLSCIFPLSRALSVSVSLSISLSLYRALSLPLPSPSLFFLLFSLSCSLYLAAVAAEALRVAALVWHQPSMWCCVQELATSGWESTLKVSCLEVHPPNPDPPPNHKSGSRTLNL